MRRVSRRWWLAAAALGAATFAAGGAYALDPGPDGWYLTGNGVRVKTIVIDIKVYKISHYMKALPDAKSKQAVIDADVDKRFVWQMLRDVDGDKVRDSLKDAYAKNNYNDAGKIGQFLSAFGDLKDGTSVVISYNSGAKTTSVTLPGGKSATVPGVDFMKGTWSIWFGNIDQPKLSDALISKL